MTWLLNLLAFMMQKLSRPAAMGVGCFLGGVFRLVTWKRFAVCERNMDLFFGEGEKSAEEKKRITTAMYRNLGKNLVEFLRLPVSLNESKPSWITVEGEEHIQQALQDNQRILFILGHFGCWDILTVYYTTLLKPVLLVTKKIRNRALQQFWETHRNTDTVRFIDKKGSSKEILQCLKKGGSLGFIIDQNMNQDNGVFIKWGTQLAGTLSAPAVLTRRYNLAVLGVFPIRQPDNSYRIVVTPPMEKVTSDDPEKDSVTNTQCFSNVLQSYVEKYPEQWIWLHRRYKTRPVGEPSLYSKS